MRAKIAKPEGDTVKVKHRSPNYPAISLREAIERGRKIYKAENRAGCFRDQALRHMGYTSANGMSLTALSSLKKYGLFEEKGGRIVPTARAIDIFVRPADDPRHITAVREAAVEPTIYAQLVERFGGNGGYLPSLDQFKAELEADMGFNPRAISTFITDFRDTLEYAGLLRDGKIISPIEDAEDDEDAPEASGDRDQYREEKMPPPAHGSYGGSGRGEAPPPPPAGFLTLTTLLPGGAKTATLNIPTGLTRDDFQYLADWIKFQGRVFASPAGNTAPSKDLDETEEAE